MRKQQRRWSWKTWLVLGVQCAFALSSQLLSACDGCTVTVDVPAAEGVGDAVCAAATTNGGNSHGCICDCGAEVTGLFGKRIRMCLPDGLNVCKGGTVPTNDDRAEQCDILADTFQGMARVVHGDPMIECECQHLGALAPPKFVTACFNECEERIMPPDAEDFANADADRYTNVAGDQPVCAETAIDPPPVEGLAGIFEPKTLCNVSGTTDLVAPEIGCPETAPCQFATSGQAFFVGRPCPEGGCGVDFGFSLDAGDIFVDVDCEVLGIDVGCDDVSIQDIHANAVSHLVGGALLDADGRGTFAAEELELLLQLVHDGEQQVYTSPSVSPTDVQVDWDSGLCGVDAVLPLITITADGVSVPLSISVHLAGTLQATPPTAQAGDDMLLECNGENGAEISLDGSASSDPDGDIVRYVWRAGTAFDAPVVSSGAEPTALAQLSSGASQEYSLRVADSSGSVALDTVTVQVEDTSAPSFDGLSIAPTCLWPPNHKYVRFDLGEELLATASDACDPSVDVQIVSVVSNQPDSAGSDLTTQDVRFGPHGLCVRAERNRDDAYDSPMGRLYTVTLRASDDAGNHSDTAVQVRVPNAYDPACPKLPNSSLIDDEQADALCAF